MTGGKKVLRQFVIIFVCLMKANEILHVFVLCSFVNLGIQCVRRKELDASLLKRKKKNIDPFNSRF